MIVKYKFVNPKCNPSFPYDRVYKADGVSGVYSDLRNDKWVIMRGKNKHCFPKQAIVIISIEMEKENEL